MGRFLRMIALLAVVALLTWLVAPLVNGAEPPPTWDAAYSLKSRRPVRPRPSEPDVTRDNSGPFRLAGTSEANDPQPDPAPLPAVYSLADATGKVWTGPNWEPLWQYVAGRNSAMQAPAPAASQTRIYRGATRCGPAGCPP